MHLRRSIVWDQTACNRRRNIEYLYKWSTVDLSIVTCLECRQSEYFKSELIEAYLIHGYVEKRGLDHLVPVDYLIFRVD